MGQCFETAAVAHFNLTDSTAFHHWMNKAKIPATSNGVNTP
jgi:hypothetical protein